MTFDADAFRVYRGLDFKIIESTAGSPGPGPEGPPIVELAGLSFINEANDALRETRAVIGLNAAGDQDRIAPSFRQHLLLPGWSRRRGRRGTAACAPREWSDESEFHHHGDFSGGGCGDGQDKLDVDGNFREGGIVDVAGEFFHNDGHVAV